MTVSSPASYFIGWDVGGWNCDKNGKSRDALVILDSTLSVVGKRRGNLRGCIAAATTTSDWLMALFTYCEAECPSGPLAVTMAIDTPLGFPEALVNLITRQGSIQPDSKSGLNRYLFRYTERHLFERGLKPLSAVKDMIGSQATKGMHVLARFAPRIESCGVWTDGSEFRAIETYPAVCRKSPAVMAELAAGDTMDHEDLKDAYVCAQMARLFSTDRHMLEEPPKDVPISEGWIWVPPMPKSPSMNANL
jgi:hypothetical protein